MSWRITGLTVWAQKTKRRRIVPIAPELLPILREAFEGNADGEALVVSDVTVPNVRRDFGVIRKKAGTPKFVKWCHTLRKNHESDWISAGFPFHVVVEWMGHSAEVARHQHLRVNASDMVAASRTQTSEKMTQIAKSDLVDVEKDSPQVLKLANFLKKAGDRIRPDDVQLGNLTPSVIRRVNHARKEGYRLQGMCEFAPVCTGLRTVERCTPRKRDAPVGKIGIRNS